MLWRWTTIWIFSGGRPNSQTASISSRPLFIRVAESMVIFAPMFQLGCFRASALVLPRSSSVFVPKKGPPDAVSRILVRLLALSLSCKHWKMAECSLSTGSSLTPCFAHRLCDQMAAGDKALLVGQGQVVAALDGGQAGRQTRRCPPQLFSTTSGPSMAASSFRPSGPVSSLGALARPASACIQLGGAHPGSVIHDASAGEIPRSARRILAPHDCGPTDRRPHSPVRG